MRQLWSKDTARWGLRNASYVGHITPHRGVIDDQAVRGNFEPIISRALWEQVRAIRERRTVVKHGTRQTKRTYLPSGTVHCGACGARLRGISTGRRGDCPRYACSNRVSRHSCDQPFALADVLDTQVSQFIETFKAQVSVRAAPRTVNMYRQIVSAIFNYGMRPSTYELPVNPATFADRRREPEPNSLAFYSPEQVEALARAFESGAHRDPNGPVVEEPEQAARAADDARDAELIRVAAYTGLRRGELIALRWRDVDFVGHKLTVRRTLSGQRN